MGTLAAASHGHLRTPSPRYPYVTGTSVIGLTYRDGIMLACDTLGEWVRGLAACGHAACPSLGPLQPQIWAQACRESIGGCDVLLTGAMRHLPARLLWIHKALQELLAADKSEQLHRAGRWRRALRLAVHQQVRDRCCSARGVLCVPGGKGVELTRIRGRCYDGGGGAPAQGPLAAVPGAGARAGLTTAAAHVLRAHAGFWTS